MPEARAHLVIHGRVQGVFFRYATRETAVSLGCTGWVKNNFDGTVEAVFEGPKEDVGTAVGWCGRGPSGARVDSVDLEWEDPTGEFSRFEIRGW